MSALTCDICGGNLAMNESGEFAVCESCGMKHTKERVKVKVQEIKGVVEITKGEAEKERLLKNAETFLSLADIPKALEIYKQIANDYPNEVKSWIGIAECCFLRLPKQYEEGELTKAGSEISSIYFELLEAQKKAVILDATCQNEFDALWKKHQEKVENYTLELIDRYQNNDCLEDVLLELVKPNCYIPMSKQKLLSQLKENAMRLENEIRNPQCFKRIYEVGIARAKSYRFGLEDIVQSPVEHIEYLASREAIVSFSHYGGKTFNYICFDEPYSVEILAAKMMAPTDAENKRIKNLNLLQHFLDNIPNICDFIREFGYKTKENDSFKTTFDIYNVHIKMNKDVTTDEPSLTIIYDYSVNEYCKITKRAKIGTHQNIEKTYMGSVEEINSIKAFCKKKNLCVHCGGKFKGVFKKVCSKCGKPKDY